MGIVKYKYVANGKDIIIRNAEIEDAENVIKHINIVDAETIFLAREPGEFTMTKEEEEEFISGQKESLVNLFVVAEVDNEIVGTCALMGNNRARYKHCASFAIAVQKKSWGLGIGKYMMQVSMDWAKDRGVERLSLDVDTLNKRAINLYLGLGFVIEGRTDNDRKMADGTYRSSYIMGLLLKKY